MFERKAQTNLFQALVHIWPAAAPLDGREECECLSEAERHHQPPSNLLRMHEPHIEKLTRGGAARGTLIDLGANIGMTSALAGHHFTHADWVEPTKLVRIS